MVPPRSTVVSIHQFIIGRWGQISLCDRYRFLPSVTSYLPHIGYSPEGVGGLRPKHAAAACILHHETWLLSLYELVITWHESLVSKVLSGNSLVVQWLGLRWSSFNPWLGNPKKNNPPSPHKGAFSIWCSSAFETKGLCSPVLSSNRIYALSSVRQVSLPSSSTCGRAGTQELWVLWRGASLLIPVQVRTQL